MGIDTFAKRFVFNRYSPAITDKAPSDQSIVSLDLMQYVKYAPESVQTVGEMVNHLLGKVNDIVHSPAYRTVDIIIILVDRRPPHVKRMVTHTRRYNGINRLSAKRGPYLGGDDAPIPNPWIAFAGNFRNLQRELYPRLFNAFMDHTKIMPRPGQMFILHGFPGYCERQQVRSTAPWSASAAPPSTAEVVHIWDVREELPLTRTAERVDKDLYNRVFVIEHKPASQEHPHGLYVRQEWVDARNDISEADSAMAFYGKWWPQKNITYAPNDGDVIITGLLYTRERVDPVTHEFRNVAYGRLPHKPTKQELEVLPARSIAEYDFINFNLLYQLVMEDSIMVEHGVQNPVLTLVFLIIMGECDFLKGHMKGIGKEKFVLGTFMQSIGQFSHLVQAPLYVTPSTCTQRVVIIDEDCFRIFVYQCYLAKYESKAKGNPITFHGLAELCSMGRNAEKDPAYCLPNRNTVRVWCRQVGWAIRYFMNSQLCTVNVPNPFETWKDFPYYPYAMVQEPGAAKAKPTLLDYVSPYQKPVDSVYAQHFISEHKRPLPNGARRNKAPYKKTRPEDGGVSHALSGDDGAEPMQKRVRKKKRDVLRHFE